MILLLALGLYLFVGLVLAGAVACGYIEPNEDHLVTPTTRLLIFLIAPWALLLAFAEGDDPVELWNEIKTIVLYGEQPGDDIEL